MMNLFQADSEQIASTLDVSVSEVTEESQINSSKQNVPALPEENEQHQSHNTEATQNDQ